MENQNNQNDKPADGYAQAPQQEEKSVLAELAEFVSRKKEAAQSVNVPAEAKQNVEKAQNTASAADEGGKAASDETQEEKNFFETVWNYLLQEKQKKVIERNLF